MRGVGSKEVFLFHFVLSVGLGVPYESGSNKQAEGSQTIKEYLVWGTMWEQNNKGEKLCGLLLSCY